MEVNPPHDLYPVFPPEILFEILQYAPIDLGKVNKFLNLAKDRVLAWTFSIVDGNHPLEDEEVQRDGQTQIISHTHPRALHIVLGSRKRWRLYSTGCVNDNEDCSLMTPPGTRGTVGMRDKWVILWKEDGFRLPYLTIHQHKSHESKGPTVAFQTLPSVHSLYWMDDWIVARHPDLPAVAETYKQDAFDDMLVVAVEPVSADTWNKLKIYQATTNNISQQPTCRNAKMCSVPASTSSFYRMGPMSAISLKADSKETFVDFLEARFGCHPIRLQNLHFAKWHQGITMINCATLEMVVIVHRVE
jgi:hypothetical protein